MELKGVHHLTAVSAAIRENYRFYTRVMGMRLVKRSVNQDDVSAYHLFYADAVGSPGTDLTFFDWRVPRERRGTRSISRTGLRVAGEAIGYWHDRLSEAGLAVSEVLDRDGRATIDFEDPEGQRLCIADDHGLGDPPVAWDGSPVPTEYQVRGLGPIELSVPDLESTATILREVMVMRQVREYRRGGGDDATVHVFEMGGGGGIHTELHVAVEPNAPVARPGAGGVHHVAFRVDDDSYEAWARRLNSMGVRNSGPVDRYYFRSLYFREPNGILFELATEGPGFAVDEDVATLGEEIVLPPFLEPRREQIVTNLVPID